MVQSENSVLSSDKLIPFLSPFTEQPFWVAFSGGGDSTVLLHLLVDLRNKGIIKSLNAVHVNHGLSPHAEDWADHCRQICQQWSVPLSSERVVIHGQSAIELQAREARYQLFEQLLPEQGCLLMGHHLDDQAETVLFRLFRGVGLDGLSGIPSSRALGEGILLRPLLDFSRQDIEAYAEQHGLSCIEDESNQDERFARNYLRQSLIPQIDQQWSGVSARLADLAKEAAENKMFLDGLVSQYYAQVVQAPPSKLWGRAEVIDLQALSSLEGSLAKKIIRFWLEKHHCTMPDRKQLDIVFAELIAAKDDAEPVVRLVDKELRRFQHKLVIRTVDSELCSGVISWDWRTEKKRLLTECSYLEMGSGGHLLLPNQELTIKYRSDMEDGIKVRVSGRQGSKTVKRWLQEYHVPPWMRDRVPFLFAGEQMIAAADLWTCDGYKAQDSRGCSLVWVVDSADSSAVQPEAVAG